MPCCILEDILTPDFLYNYPSPQYHLMIVETTYRGGRNGREERREERGGKEQDRWCPDSYSIWIWPNPYLCLCFWMLWV